MDFASASGQNVLLVGPPGSGKTTLINDFMDFQSSKYKISLHLTKHVIHSIPVRSSTCLFENQNWAI